MRKGCHCRLGRGTKPNENSHISRQGWVEPDLLCWVSGPLPNLPESDTDITNSIKGRNPTQIQMRYRRARAKGGTYFFTVVTHKRVKIFNRSDNVELLRQAFRKVIKRHPFKIDAFVLLPDHLHCIWTLPQGDADFSTRWRLIKSSFSRQIRLVGWVEERNPTNKATSRLRKVRH